MIDDNNHFLLVIGHERNFCRELILYLKEHKAHLPSKLIVMLGAIMYKYIDIEFSIHP